MMDNPQLPQIKLNPRRLQIQAWLKATFLSGLVVLTPLGLTIYLLTGIVASADEIFDHLPAPLRPEHRYPGSGLLLAFLAVILAGIVARNLFGRLLFASVSGLFERIPIVASLYKLLRQIAEAFLGGTDHGFRAVVLVEWPRKDIWMLAFVTSDLDRSIASRLAHRPHALDDAAIDDAWLNLFIPTTPNPTGGFHFMARERDCRPSGLSVEDAFKVIISGGALSPVKGREVVKPVAERAPQ